MNCVSAGTKPETPACLHGCSQRRICHKSFGHCHFSENLLHTSPAAGWLVVSAELGWWSSDFPPVPAAASGPRRVQTAGGRRPRARRPRRAVLAASLAGRPTPGSAQCLWRGRPVPRARRRWPPRGVSSGPVLPAGQAPYKQRRRRFGGGAFFYSRVEGDGGTICPRRRGRQSACRGDKICDNHCRILPMCRAGETRGARDWQRESAP